MADDDQPDEASKTEDPSPKKLEESRERGQVPHSREVNTWIMLLAVTLLIGSATPSMFSNFAIFLRSYFEQAHMIPGMQGGIAFILRETFWNSLGYTFVFFLVLMFAAFLGPFMQFGLLFSAETIKPDFKKISIMKGFERLFSLKSIVEFVKGLLKLSVVSVVSFVMLYPYMPAMEHMIGQPFVLLMHEMKDLTMRLMGGILAVLLVTSLADLFYQRWDFNKKMRMTKQEVKDEYKQTEGDPHIKGRLKQLRMERARKRMMQAVPKADVIITNPTHYSIALQYDPEKMEAPVVIAKGIDAVALRIREVAKEHNIELYENKPLARTLYDTVDLDEAIPQELYKAVAEIISFVFKKKGKLKSRK